MSKQKVYDLVKGILEANAEARDNDMYLCAIVWYRHLKTTYNIHEVRLTDFFHIMRNYKKMGLLSYETISRGRRLVQEAHVELRGEEYNRRHAKQAEVIEDIKQIIHNNHVQHESKPNEELLNGQVSLFANG